ncbi:spore germination protein [Natronobacillus azotifigens]|uniref:GerAB/ArcD/ProY family transporter n=1 Tax=Natronobacillus azotifigens TaxID=472978 RepID=A0A9J6RB01_9BACI|nr:GerAB/ArcD/ProY family transporter [Natronobacillus azotifigens]
MPNQREPVTTVQLACVIINSTIGISVLSLPRWGAEIVGSGGVFATFLALIFYLIFLVILSLVARRFPEQNLIQFGNKIVGKYISFIFGLMITVLFVLLTSMVIREFGEVMATTLLRETPLEVSLFVMLAIVAIASRKNISEFGYIHFYYIPFIIMPGLFLISMAIPEGDFFRILPVLGNEPSLTGMLDSSMTIIALPFFQIGLYTLTVIFPKMQDPKKALKGSLYGWIGVFIMIMSITTVTYAALGAEQINEEVWPVLALARSISFPMPPFQRLDIFFIVFWIITAFTTILSGFLISIHTFADTFKMNNHRKLSYWFLPVFLFVALVPENNVQMYDWMPIIGKTSLVITAGYPTLLVIISMFKK